MSTKPDGSRCARADDVGLYALNMLARAEAVELEIHIASCESCRRELDALRPVVDSFAAWSRPMPRPQASPWDQLVARIGGRVVGEDLPSMSANWVEPEWEDVAPGISCQLLSSDSNRDRVTMMVRLAPGTDYPPHTHAGVEELHLLEGVLWIDDRKLYPGDYNRAERRTSDRRVWTETGCTCLLITSPSDALSSPTHP